LLALLAGPLALAPAQRLRMSLAQARDGQPIWGADRHDEWGMIARQAAGLPSHDNAPLVALPAATEGLRETTEAMSRLLLDSGHELTRLRGEAAAGVNDAVMLGARLADAVLDAEARLKAGVSRAQLGWDHPEDGASAAGGSEAGRGFSDAGAMWSAASAHADRLEEAATRALAAATVLPAAAERIERAIAGLDRMAETVAANSDGLADLAARAGAAAAMLPEAAERIERAAHGLGGVTSRTSSAAAVLPQAAQLIAQASAELSRAAEAVATNASGLNEAVARHTEAAASLPDVARRIANAVVSLDGSAVAIGEVVDHARHTGRAAAATTADTEAVQRAVLEATRRMTSVGEQLPQLASQLGESMGELDRSAGVVARAAERAETSSRTMATLVDGAEAAQHSLSEVLPHMMTAGAQLPLLTSRLDTAVAALDGSTERMGEAAITQAAATQAAIHETLQLAVQQIQAAAAGLAASGDTSQASQTALTGAVACIVTASKGLEAQLPALTTEFAEQVDRLAQNIIGLDQSAARIAETASEAAAQAALAQDASEVKRSSLEETVQQMADLADAMTGTLPPLSARISTVIGELDQSAAALSMIGASAGEALPTAAARLDEALAGLDSMVRVIGEAAETAAASIGEAAVTQSALSQTVQCMASVGEALPSLAMRLEGTLGALDRSAGSICAAANDVAEAGRAISASANATPDESGERRPSYGSPRPVPDASMRRLQSVASALAMAGSGTHG
jgi:chromosome segregation ATPase